MPKFYVPMIFIVEAEDENGAMNRIEEFADSMHYLQPKNIDGGMMSGDLAPSPASDHWTDIEQNMGVIDGKFVMIEGKTNE